MEESIKSTPEIFNKISPIMLKRFAFFKNEAERPINTIITPCPKAKINNIKADIKTGCFLWILASFLQLQASVIQECRLNSAPSLKLTMP